MSRIAEVMSEISEAEADVIWKALLSSPGSQRLLRELAIEAMHELGIKVPNQMVDKTEEDR